jgi:hypothetical protein
LEVLLTTVRTKESKKIVAKTLPPKETQIEIEDKSEIIEVVPPLPASQPGVQPAYLEYLHARKELADAFRARVEQDRTAYEEAQRQYHLCQQMIDRAFDVREQAERDALNAYHRSIEESVKKASVEYRVHMKQALVACRKTTVEAWRNSIETSIKTSQSFQNDKIIVRKHDEMEKNIAKSTLQKIGRTVIIWKDKAVVTCRRSSQAVGRFFDRNLRALR